VELAYKSAEATIDKERAHKRAPQVARGITVEDYAAHWRRCGRRSGPAT
jgi:hypothetical protein